MIAEESADYEVGDYERSGKDERVAVREIVRTTVMRVDQQCRGGRDIAAREMSESVGEKAMEQELV